MSNIINPVELTSKLIKCESITPKSAGSIDLIISLLEPLGFSCKKVDAQTRSKTSVNELLRD